MRKIHYIITLIVSLLPTLIVAQNGYNDPFSQYGLTQSSLPTYSPFSISRGGALLTRSGSNYVNPFNPASYAGIQLESFVFDISLQADFFSLSSGDESISDFDGSLSSLMVAMPITQWWKVALGLQPFSSVNYETVVIEPIENTTQMVKTRYDGTGGITQFLLGNAFNIIGNPIDNTRPSLSAGFNLNFYYGKVQRAITYDYVASDTSFFQDTRRQKNTSVQNITLDFGLLYTQPIGHDNTIRAALTIKAPQTMNIDDESLIYTFVTRGTQEYTLDTIFPRRGKSSFYESTLEQPLTVGVGLAFNHSDLWEVAFDATYASYSGLKYEEGLDNPIFGASGITYDDNVRVALGGGWLGNANAPSYWGRIGITGGVHYERGKLQLELADGMWSLDEWGVGLGITFPMRKGRSQLLLTCGYSNYGTPDLLRSEVITLGLTLSSSEHWFAKRKYN